MLRSGGVFFLRKVIQGICYTIPKTQQDLEQHTVIKHINISAAKCKNSPTGRIKIVNCLRLVQDTFCNQSRQVRIFARAVDLRQVDYTIYHNALYEMLNVRSQRGRGHRLVSSFSQAQATSSCSPGQPNSRIFKNLPIFNNLMPRICYLNM